jgi:hypothetical protein
MDNWIVERRRRPEMGLVRMANSLTRSRAGVPHPPEFHSLAPRTVALVRVWTASSLHYIATAEHDCIGAILRVQPCGVHPATVHGPIRGQNSTPKGRRTVATGEAQRNPWKCLCFPEPAPEGQRNRPAAHPAPPPALASLDSLAAARGSEMAVPEMPPKCPKWLSPNAAQ